MSETLRDLRERLEQLDAEYVEAEKMLEYLDGCGARAEDITDAKILVSAAQTAAWLAFTQYRDAMTRYED
jgi:predicted kinase